MTGCLSGIHSVVKALAWLGLPPGSDGYDAAVGGASSSLGDAAHWFNKVLGRRYSLKHATGKGKISDLLGRSEGVFAVECNGHCLTVHDGLRQVLLPLTLPVLQSLDSATSGTVRIWEAKRH